MMVNGSASVAAPMPDVWKALQDPAVLASTIPGCESLDEVAPDTYRMTIRAGVASIKGTYAVGGMIGGVGQRMLAGVGRKTAGL